MKIARISVWLSSLLFASFGLAFFFWPTRMAGLVEIQLPGATATNDFRATYGGWEIGLALFFACCARHDQWLKPALLAQVCSLAGFALTRAAGCFLDGQPKPIIFALMLAELSGCALGIWAWRRLNADQNAALAHTIATAKVSPKNEVARR
ncbi:MAG: DUF4345 domain-containing protein [Verrucomicrobiota bacterium]|jgi:hypothetical protein